MVKKLFTITFSLLVGVFLVTNAYALNAAQMQGGNPDNWYTEVQLNTTAAGVGSGGPAHGQLVEWDVDSDTGETLGVTVHTVDAATSELVAGIVPAWDDTAHNLDGLGRVPVDGETFLIQIKGYHSGACTDGNVTESGGLTSTALGLLGDGDGLGVGLKADAANDSTNLECGWDASSTFAPVFFHFGDK